MTIEQYPSSNNIATTTVWKYTATGSELTLSGYDNYSQALQFTAGSEQVYLNGVLLVRNLDYTPAANGLSITFPSSLAYNDFVQIYCYSNYSIASVASSSITGTIQNAQLTNSSITIGNQSISLGNAITTLTGTSISGSTNTLTNIPNSALSNSTIIINGNPISLGGTVNITTPNTILSQKGGLIVGTGAGNVAQLAVGADGAYPIADSTQTTGLNWYLDSTLFKNKVVNGNFISDQVNKGAVVNGAKGVSYKLADKWSMYNLTTGTGLWSYQTVFNASDGPTGFLNYGKLTTSTAASSIPAGDRMILGFDNDQAVLQDLQWGTANAKSVTVSFWVRSSVTGTYGVMIKTNASQLAWGIPYTINSANTWQKISTVIPGPTTGTFNQLGSNFSFYFDMGHTVTTGTTDISTGSWVSISSTDSWGVVGATAGNTFATTLGATFSITGLQMEAGSIPTTYKMQGGSLQGEILTSGPNNFDGIFYGATSSSSYSTGLTSYGWAGYQVAGKNALLNGAFDHWTRGTSFSIAVNTYTADRFAGNRGSYQGGQTISQQSPGSTLPQFNYCARVQRNSGDTQSGSINIWQGLTTANSLRFAGQYVTFSFYIRYGSGMNQAVGAYLYTGTGTDQQINGYTNITLANSIATSISSSWTRYSMTCLIPSNATEITPILAYGPTGTASATEYFETTGWQLELGTGTTNFSRAGGNVEGELVLCQNYFRKINGGLMCIGNSSTDVYTSIPYAMRTTPAGSLTGPCIIDRYGVGNWTQSSANITTASTYTSTSGIGIVLGAFSGLSQGWAYILRTDGGSILLDAELH